MEIQNQLKRVKDASIKLGAAETTLKNNALAAIAKQLDLSRAKIVEQNEIDLNNAKQQNLGTPLLKRLCFNDSKIDDVILGINSLISLEDPVGKTLMATELDTDLNLFRVSSPIGVIGVIFESRPDALVQIATLCLKSGNGIILKGGSEAINTNRILFETIKEATLKAGITDEWIQLIESREEVKSILEYDNFIDLIIPRGSNSFVQYIMHNTKIPVMGHADGICHCYIDSDADIEKAVCVAVDSKTQYVSVCNATETILVNSKIADAFLPRLAKALAEKGCQIRCCNKSYDLCMKNTDNTTSTHAEESDWEKEYLDYVVSVKVVDSLSEAIEHINRYGSGHTDAIITENMDNAKTFMNLVDSGNVMLNCSTRFSDGFRYGFGAEVGISTSKIHARGPVGLDGLVIYKYKLFGNGHIVDDYATKKKSFKHLPLDEKTPF